MTKSILIVARHGNTFDAGETPRRVGARTNLPLVASGIEQAHRLAQHLENQGLTPGRIIAGPLRRTQQMADIVRQDLGLEASVETADFLREIDYGPDENQPEAAVIARIGHDALAAWEHHAVAPAGWIVDPAALERSWTAFARNLGPGVTLAVTSNGIARFARILDPHGAAANDLKLSTGAFALFRRTDDSVSWACTAWNVRP